MPDTKRSDNRDPKNDPLVQRGEKQGSEGGLQDDAEAGSSGQAAQARPGGSAPGGQSPDRAGPDDAQRSDDPRGITQQRDARSPQR
jgi:hypothetical protein